MNNIELIDMLAAGYVPRIEELASLIGGFTQAELDYAGTIARGIAQRHFGNSVYIRGIVEFTNICRNNCYYCGIRRGNNNVERYRLTKEEIMECCEAGYSYGYRTFVLQGGEDPYYDDDRMCDIVASIKTAHPDCAITLSLGERSYDSYKRLKEAGADRYLLRHETADEEHYGLLHPAELSLKNRIECLYNLKELGYQVGCGCMVGSPFQRPEHLAKDLLFMQEFRPHMIGLGPFIPHHDTPFKDMPAGAPEQTLMMLALSRIMIPDVLLPATTALGTIDPMGREKGVLCGANVIMPNLSPKDVREQYKLYDGKICTGEESAECRGCLEKRMERIGYRIEIGRGDHPEMRK